VLDPAQPHLLSLRGVLALDQGRPEQARRDLQAALGADPGLAAAWANLGVLHHEQGDHAEAVRCYDRSLALAADADVAMNRDLAAAALSECALTTP
jgi:tetratricopeptide (TPR) repeat protein